MRAEEDELGTVSLPDDALYGIQSLRGAENFALGFRPVNPRLVAALVTVKKAAAITWRHLAEKMRSGGKAGSGTPGETGKYDAVIAACDRILAGEAADAFITDALQGGAGTSLNMNVNEVIANLALTILGRPPGSYDIVHPLDDVNRGQSTNDVYPTALRIASVALLRELSDSCAQLQEALQRKENEFADVRKLGRTELMDAVPVTLGEEFGAFAQAIGRDRWRLYKAEERLRQVNLGGAAVGLFGRGSPAEGGADSVDASDSVAVERNYRFMIIEELRVLTGIGLAAAEYPMDITQNWDVFVEVSGLLKALAVNLTKISNDLRLMNSGPAGGLGEISIPAVQKGSTIMPGKVNPVIPEMVMQAAMRVMANDSAISAAASRGEFELNSFAPLIADSILESLSLLCRAVSLFRTKCIEGIKANPERSRALLEASLSFAASWVPLLGYDTVARIIAEERDPARARAALEAAAGEAGA